ncbi:unnamed protein product [Cuscuta epithymum]|uniref:Uncharacterized protein n=1 Tax=Cuscuta epithymum TaxID=186058 RepID=A0AAV0EFL0_9ASTE|nr:unnamed protein product [Cuscuta epithymum]CAH9122594.1 unnamed protein product [Cuscuta epithymum]
MNSSISLRFPQNQLWSGTPLMQAEQCYSSSRLVFFPFSHQKPKFGSLTVKARGRSNEAASFIGGFVLGGILVGALGCIYAPQLSKVLSEADRKDLLRKMPKFIYDEEKSLEKTRKTLAAKIEQLNFALDSMSSQLNVDDVPKKVAAKRPDEVEASK